MTMLEVEERSALSVFDVHDPQIRVEFAFARDDLRARGTIYPVFVMKPREPSHTVIARLALRGRTKDGHPAIKAVQNNENRPGFGCATLTQRAERALDFAAAQVS